MCREAARVMKEQGHGRIVNIASRAWLGNRGQSNYAASKAGVVALTRVLALELGRYGVIVNTVAPGLIDAASRATEPHVLQTLIDAQPTRTMGKPEDVAHARGFPAEQGHPLHHRADPLRGWWQEHWCWHLNESNEQIHERPLLQQRHGYHERSH